MQNFGTAGAQKRSKIISTRGTTSELSHTSPRLSGFPHRPRVRGPVVRHLGAMVLSPPAPTRRRGSLRASDVPSGSAGSKYFFLLRHSQKMMVPAVVYLAHRRVTVGA